MDPLCSKIQVKKSYGINLIEPDTGTYDAVLLAVPHDKIIKNGIEKIVSLCSSNRIIFDLKSALPENDFVYRL